MCKLVSTHKVPLLSVMRAMVEKEIGNQNNSFPGRYFIAVVISCNTSVTSSFVYKQKGEKCLLVLETRITSLPVNIS